MHLPAFTLGAVSMLLAATVHADALLDSDNALVNSGHVLYQHYCASCHGADARGGAADASHATVKVPDLTTLAKRNGGSFQIGAVYDVVSGSELLPAHGTRVMPVWGTALQETPGLSAADAMAVIRGRILSIIAYLGTLQSR